MSSLDEDPLEGLKTQASHAYRRLHQMQIDGLQQVQQALSDVQETHETLFKDLEAQITGLEMDKTELKTNREPRAQRAKLQTDVNLKARLYRVRLRNLLENGRRDMDGTDLDPQVNWLIKQTSGADCLLDADMLLGWDELQWETCKHVRDTFVNIYGMTPHQILYIDGQGDFNKQLLKVLDHQANKSLKGRCSTTANAFRSTAFSTISTQEPRISQFCNNEEPTGVPE